MALDMAAEAGAAGERWSRRAVGADDVSRVERASGALDALLLLVAAAAAAGGDAAMGTSCVVVVVVVVAVVVAARHLPALAPRGERGDAITPLSAAISRSISVSSASVSLHIAVNCCDVPFDGAVVCASTAVARLADALLTYCRSSARPLSC
jgi:hypothetical protein